MSRSFRRLGPPKLNRFNTQETDTIPVSEWLTLTSKFSRKPRK